MTRKEALKHVDEHFKNEKDVECINCERLRKILRDVDRSRTGQVIHRTGEPAKDVAHLSMKLVSIILGEIANLKKEK